MASSCLVASWQHMAVLLMLLTGTELTTATPALWLTDVIPNKLHQQHSATSPLTKSTHGQLH